MESRIGQQFGNYRLLRLIGHGGFADVYLGEHIYMGTQAAIKVLHTQLGEREIERFRLEASMVARLEHPHIIRVLDFGVANTIPFLVMSYAPNGTLRERYPRGTVLPLPTVVRYARQVADALQYAHNERIIHRDIKPENMLLGKRNEILLSDFGIALISQNSQSQSPKDLAGTAAYMAPEQIDAHPRPASDQYALGIIVYEWLSGSCPFSGTFTEIALKHATVPPPPLSKKAPGISAALEEVILTALAKDPGKRFASVQAFAQALEQAAGPMIGTDSAEAPTMLLEERNFGAPASGQAALTPPQQASSGLTPVIAEVPPTMVTPPRPGVSGQIPVTPNVPPAMHTPPNQPALFLVQPSPEGTNHDPTLRNSAERAGRPGPSAQAGQGVVTPFLGLESTPSTIDAPVPLPRYRFSPVVLILLAALAVLVIGGGVFGYLRFFAQPVQKQPVHLSPQQIQATAVAKMQAGHPQAIDAYNQAMATNGAMFGFDTQHTHFNPYEAILNTQNIANVQNTWVASLNSAIYYSSPAVVNGVIYVGARNGKLYAFDATSGQRKWVATTGTDAAIYSSPAVANGVVYVGSTDHKLYAFDAATGQKRWVGPTGNMIYSSPVVADGIVYIGSYDHKLYAFDAATGQKRWASPTGSVIAYSAPAVANGTVYISSYDHKLYAFNALTGQQKWAATTEGVLYSSPTVVNNVVYIGSYDQNLYAFNARTGRKMWSVSVDSKIFSSPAVVDGIVYVGTFSGKLYAFDATKGSQKWIAQTEDVIEASPLVANGLIYIGSWDHDIYAFDALTGQQRWVAKTEGQIYASPSVANGMIYVGSSDGKLYAFSLVK